MLCEGILSVCECVCLSVPLYLSQGVSSSLSISHSLRKAKGEGERMGWGRGNTSGKHIWSPQALVEQWNPGEGGGGGFQIPWFILESLFEMQPPGLENGESHAVHPQDRPEVEGGGGAP